MRRFTNKLPRRGITWYNPFATTSFDYFSIGGVKL